MASSCVASPPPRNKTATSRPTSSAFASSCSSFGPRSSPFLTHTSSLSHLSLFGCGSSSPSSPPSSSSMRFSIDRPTSPRQSMSVAKQTNNAVSSNKRMCMCAPTTHPGSFRCLYHKRLAEQKKNRAASSQSMQSSSTSRNLRLSAMKNSLVRIGGLEGELVKRTLTTLIRPSSHQLRRREAFQPRRSRLSMMSKAED